MFNYDELERKGLSPEQFIPFLSDGIGEPADFVLRLNGILESLTLVQYDCDFKSLAASITALQQAFVYLIIHENKRKEREYSALKREHSELSKEYQALKRKIQK